MRMRKSFLWMFMRNTSMAGQRRCGPGFAAVVAGCGLFASHASAQSVVPQFGPNPVAINMIVGPDDPTILTAGSAERLSSETVQFYSGGLHYRYLDNFNTVDDYLDWNITSDVTAPYQVVAPLNTSAPNQTLNFSIDGSSPVAFTVANTGWQRANLGSIVIPAGTHHLRLTRGTLGGDLQITALELLKTSLVPAYNDRIAAFVHPYGRMNSNLYGLFFQYGRWGYPQTGTTKKSLDAQAIDFNVTDFVYKVKATGAQYVIWSTSWFTYEHDEPNDTINGIVGDHSLTSSRALISEVAAALKAEKIDFYLYYHLGYGTPAWWSHQPYPSDFYHTGAGDRTAYFSIWQRVVSEMGTRLGTNLDGWFFDDGQTYYPAPFESLGAAARTGNPNRTVTYNSHIQATNTPFNDLSFGEICRASDSPINSRGLYTQGGDRNNFGHCMYQMESEWGIHSPNQAVGALNYTVDSAESLVRANRSRGVPTSFNLQMYEDGTMSQPTLDVLAGLKARVAASPCGEGCAQVNNTDPGITYAGSWSTSSNRPTTELNQDLAYTQTNGDSATINFTGNSIRLFMPVYSAYGRFNVTLDGGAQGTFSAANPEYVSRAMAYSASGLAQGAHTVTITKVDGSYMQLDYYEIDSLVTVNNDDSGISYNGGWSYSGGRNAGDFKDDVQYTRANGASATINFVGSAVQLYMPTNSDEGNFEVVIDGASQGSFSAVSPTYMSQVKTFSKTGLVSGPHTLTFTKTSGTYMQLDYYKYF